MFVFLLLLAWANVMASATRLNLSRETHETICFNEICYPLSECGAHGCPMPVVCRVVHMCVFILRAVVIVLVRMCGVLCADDDDNDGMREYRAHTNVHIFYGTYNGGVVGIHIYTQTIDIDTMCMATGKTGNNTVSSSASGEWLSVCVWKNARAFTSSSFSVAPAWLQ